MPFENKEIETTKKKGKRKEKLNHANKNQVLAYTLILFSHCKI